METGESIQNLPHVAQGIAVAGIIECAIAIDQMLKQHQVVFTLFITVGRIAARHTHWHFTGQDLVKHSFPLSHPSRCYKCTLHFIAGRKLGKQA